MKVQREYASAAPRRGGRATTDRMDQDLRTERALVAYVRQELSAPATAIMGYAEMMMDDAVQSDRAQLTDDLQRILDASRNLHRLILGLLEPAAAGQDGAGLADRRRNLRHDLRTPINAIKGYGEMLREDAEEMGIYGLISDLDKLLEESVLLLDRIDGLVAFSGGEEGSSAGGAVHRTAPSHVVEALVRTVQPIAAKEDELVAVQPSRILVVDDNPSNRDLLTRRLERQGHSVQQAEDGTVALAMVEQDPPDLILLDLMMPGISGYDVLAWLKVDPRYQDIPVIMVSALTELDSIVRCIEAGAEDYLAKPFDPTLLRARIGSSLEKKHLRDREREMVKALRAEQDRSAKLLLNILPKQIVARLNAGETVLADQLSDVTILFADLVAFSKLSSQLSAEDLVRFLNDLFSEFDRLALKFGVEKIKTLGDAYMAAGGVPEPRADHAQAVAELALAMIETVERFNADYNLPTPLRTRIGIHSGDVVAGVIGTHKFVYDIWGDSVNVASRMESYSEPNRIQVSAATHRHLEAAFQFEPPRIVDVEGKGPMQTYFLIGRTGRQEP